MRVAISAESSIDLTKELLEKYDIRTVPFTIIIKDQQYLDGEIIAPEIIRKANELKVLPKTSAVNEYQFDTHFEELLSEYDAVIHFSLSSEVTSAYNNAINSEKKHKNVFVIDSRSISTGVALLAIYARELLNKGEEVESVCKKCLMRLPNIHASVTLNSLEYLHKGGRCSMLAYIGATLLKIRPQVTVIDGKLCPTKKFRGNYARVVKNYCEEIVSEHKNADLSMAFITYTTASEEIIKSAVDIVKRAGFKEVYVTMAGGTVTSHTGEDCLGLLFFDDSER